MMQPQVLHPSWHSNLYFQQNLDQSGIYDPIMDFYVVEHHNFSSSITTHDDSMISTDSYFPTLSSNDIGELLVEGLEDISSTSVDNLFNWCSESEEIESFSSLCSSPFMKSLNQSLEFMEVEGDTGVCHLLKAYGEAMEMGQIELANVIVRCINEKVSPVGGTMERIAFNLFQSGNQGDYLKQESMKNFKAAFTAFYEIFPYGRFSHFAANSAILEAVMSDSGKVHIIDFDMGEGVQWPPLIEAIGKLRKAIKLTSIRTNEQSYSFEETKNRLLDYSSFLGIKLEVQEITIGDLVKAFKNKEHEKEFLAFNCMIGLPHMGRRTSMNQLIEFIRVAKRLLVTNKGIIAFGNGEDRKRTKECNGYSLFFNDYLTHYQALYESMECSLPENLTEGRIAMESLFVTPFVSCLSWRQKWEEDIEDFVSNIGLEGWSVSNESLVEAKEMVKERESPYKIKVEGKNGNEMVLEWRGIPLVRVSVWK